MVPVRAVLLTLSNHNLVPPCRQRPPCRLRPPCRFCSVSRWASSVADSSSLHLSEADAATGRTWRQPRAGRRGGCARRAAEQLHPSPQPSRSRPGLHPSVASSAPSRPVLKFLTPQLASPSTQTTTTALPCVTFTGARPSPQPPASTPRYHIDVHSLTVQATQQFTIFSPATLPIPQLRSPPTPTQPHSPP